MVGVARIIKTNMKNKKSQTILEIVLAIGIASMVLTALVILAAASVKTSNSSLRRAEASKYATAGIEAMRYQRDTKGLTAGVFNGCFKIKSDGTLSVDTRTCPPEGDDIGNGFKRSIVVADYGSDGDMKKITVTVTWQEKSNTPKQVIVSTVLSKWKN